MSSQDTPHDLSMMSMLDLFRLEAENHCTTLTNDLAALELNPAALDPLDPLIRAVHSIKGAAHIVEIVPIVHITGAMQRAMQAGKDGLPLAPKTIALFRRGVEIIMQVARLADEDFAPWLAGHEQEIANLVQAIKASGEAPASLPTKDERAELARINDLSMITIFRMETENFCAILSKDLLKLENSPTALDLLTSMMRAAHSIKGAARIIELHQVVGLAHAMEDLFVAGQSRKIRLSPREIDAALQAVDLLKELSQIPEKQVEGWLADNDTRLQEQGALLSAMAAGNPPPLQPPAAPVKKPGPPGAKSKEPPPDSERSLRISTSGMNRLMGLAGEVLVESRWLPSFVSKNFHLKRHQDDLLLHLDKLRHLLNEASSTTFMEHSLTEMGTKVAICQRIMNENLTELEDHARCANELSHRLHREVIINRMRPFSEGLQAYPRLIRDLGRELGKQVSLQIVGAETLVDRDILEKIDAPLNHLVRNAIDHGIETPAEREANHKNRQATIRLEAHHAAGMLNISVQDDGRGIDLELLRRTVVAKNLVSEKIAADLQPQELIDFLFLPNFTTKETTNNLSGRGVGLDVVHEVIREIRGSIQTTSVLGRGTTFQLQMPLTLSVIRALVTTINDEPYAFPLVNLDHILRLPIKEIKEMEGRQYFVSKNRRIGVMTAQQILELEPIPTELPEELAILVFNGPHDQYGLIVDQFNGIRDLVVQTLNPRLGKLKNISTAAILEDGTPILIMDVKEMALGIDQIISGNQLKPMASVKPHYKKNGKKRILVVDDSITVREVERKMLGNKGYEVEVAVDGLDALHKIRIAHFDLLVTDVDMPNMDGIELIESLKLDSRFSNIPIIIISYKDRPEDHNRGLEAGADYYLTKGSFENNALIEAVDDLIGDPEL